MYGNAWKYTKNNYLGMRFLFLHEGKSEDTIKSFMYDLYELYVKVFIY